MNAGSTGIQRPILQRLCAAVLMRVWGSAWGESAFSRIEIPWVNLHVRTSCARLEKYTSHELLRGMARTAAPTRSRLCVYICRPYEHAARAGCKRSHTKPLRCVPGNSPRKNRITGRFLAAEHSSGALGPFRDSSGVRGWLRGS